MRNSMRILKAEAQLRINSKSIKNMFPKLETKTDFILKIGESNCFKMFDRLEDASAFLWIF